MPVALVLSFRQSQPGPRSPDPRGLGGTCQEGSDLPRLDSLQVSRVYTSPRAEGRRGDRHQAPHRPGSPPGMSDKVKDKFSITFSIVGMFASHAVGSLSVFFCAEITPTVIRCVWAAHGAGRGVFQGHWGCGGHCLAKLVNDPPALARVSGQGAACTGRPLGMDCCSTLTPRDPRIRGELKPGSHPGGWRDGERGFGGTSHTKGPGKGGVSGSLDICLASAPPSAAHSPRRIQGKASLRKESRKGLGFLLAEKLVSPVQRKASERESPAGYVTDLSDKYLLGTTPPPCACPAEAALKDRVAACFLKRRGTCPFLGGRGARARASVLRL